MNNIIFKKQFLLLLTLCLSITISFAQDCSAFYPFAEGVYAEYTNYNKKGKEQATATYTVTNVTSEGGKETATISSDLKDDKGEQITTLTYDIICEDNKVSLGFKSLMSAELMEQYKDMDIEISGTDIDLPNDLTVGQDLPDADMIMTINAGGMNLNMSMMLQDRKVVGQENVTTPAGTFNCYVLTYTTQLKMGLKRTGSSKQWLAKGVGLVKQEDYNKKGKIMSSGMLTKYSK
tara:strand:+ start:3120 stop:3821 length:702 start_codon:yes stop_codon:yes gene_type:complete